MDIKLRYAERAARLSLQMEGIDDPLARRLLEALVDAFYQQAGKDLERVAQRLSIHPMNRIAH
jgi:hypothetical protein